MILMSEKYEKFNSDAYTDDLKLIDEIKETAGSRKEAIHALCCRYRGIPNNNLKKPVIACVHLSSNRSLCGLDGKFVKTNADRCELCLKERREFGVDPLFGISPVELSERLGRVVHQQNKEIAALKTPMQDLINEKGTLSSRCSELQNGLLERDQQISILETENRQLEDKIKSLSENELLNENDELHKELEQKEKLNTDYRLEIDKLQALREKEIRISNEVLSQMAKMLKDLKENAPLTTEPYALTTYINNVLKRIEQFEGYINTITT